MPTAAGPLYDVDTRLRPSGNDGLLAISVESFDAYQRTQAWTYEHMALTRARPVYGSAAGRAELARGRRCGARPGARSGQARRRRGGDAADMNRHKPPGGPFDIKLGPGGLVDLEFAVHVLQLGHRIGLDPHLEVALADLHAAGLVGAEIDPALRLLTRILVILRLVSPSSAIPPEPSRALVARACGLPSWDALVAAHDEARATVRALWLGVSGSKRKVRGLRRSLSAVRPFIEAHALETRMLGEGDPVPDVTLTGMEGERVSPADFRGNKLVLYFYPKDDTSGCTREAQDFTALAGEFEKAGTWILGVSKDDPKSHAKFTGKYDLKVKLASDLDGSVCEAFGTWGEKSLYGRKYMGIDRATFLIDRDGTIARVWRKVRVAGHAEDVLAAARELP